MSFSFSLVLSISSCLFLIVQSWTFPHFETKKNPVQVSLLYALITASSCRVAFTKQSYPICITWEYCCRADVCILSFRLAAFSIDPLFSDSPVSVAKSLHDMLLHMLSCIDFHAVVISCPKTLSDEMWKPWGDKQGNSFNAYFLSH